MPRYTASVGKATAATGEWQLASGHYVPAKMLPVIVHPRPDAECLLWERHRMAPAGIPWNIPIVVVGGAWPFLYSVDAGSAAKGMTVGGEYGGAKYGFLHWDNPTIGSHTITVTVATQELNRNTSGFAEPNPVTFTLTVYDKTDTTKFLFVDASTGSNNNSGSPTSPLLNTRGWFKDSLSDTTHSGKQVFYRGGTHHWYLDPTLGSPGNGELADTDKPLVHVGYPGETVIHDFSESKIFISGSARGLYFGDAAITNSRAMNIQHFFYLFGSCRDTVGGGERFTWSNIDWSEHRPSQVLSADSTSGTDGDNASAVWAFESLTDGRRRYFSFVGGSVTNFRTIDPVTGTSWANTNGCGLFSLGDTDYVVCEVPTWRNAQGQSVYGKSKSSGRWYTWRQLDGWDANNGYWDSPYGNSYNSTISSDFWELCWSKLRTSESSTTGVTVASYVTKAPNVATSTNYYRNTLRNDASPRACIQAVPTNGNITGYYIARNVYSCDDTDGYYKTVSAVIPTPNDNIRLALADLGLNESTGSLQGAQAEYIGLYGHEVA